MLNLCKVEFGETSFTELCKLRIAKLEKPGGTPHLNCKNALLTPHSLLRGKIPLAKARLFLYNEYNEKGR